ncbi:large subunit ribosomal protein L21 [Thermoleophilum album]|uniref:Large ribosomal subunit protein bL21 n=2 Tax=Thermoleophilum album TaxID=29539 RepID=A0A1H6FSX6_THEAL|nr:large subunit ribosomal protein L21 [Thermoleophilum album]
MYAVVKVSGKQYRVEEGQSLLVDRIDAPEGERVQLEPLLWRPDDGEPVVAPEELAKVQVEAIVKAHERGPKLRILKFKPKKGYKRRTGFRAELTRLEVSKIGPRARRSSKTKKADTDGS